MREIASGIVIYCKTAEGPRFLLLYHGGKYWNFPKGKLELSHEDKRGRETSFAAALREVFEETGLRKQDLRFQEWFKVHDRYSYTRKKQRVFKIVTFYLAETSRRTVRISEEHHGYGWFLYREAVRVLEYRNLRIVLKQAHDVIRGKSVLRGEPHPQREGRNVP